MTATHKETINEILTLTVPKEIVEDLNSIAQFNDTTPEKLVYSYIVDGIAGDSLAAKRMKFTDKANKAMGRSNVPPRKVEDIFDKLVY